MSALIPINDRLWDTDDNGNPTVDFCENVEVVEKQLNILTGDVKCKVVIWLDGEPYDSVIDRSNLGAKKIVDFLFLKGVSFQDTEDTIESLQEHILDTDRVAPWIYFHNRLGFATLDNELCFLGDAPIGLPPNSKKAQSRYREVAENEDENCSLTNECSAVKPIGTFEGWHQVIKDEVEGFIPLEIALCAGFSSPIVWLLRKDGIVYNNVCYNFKGLSSTGKTTALRTAVAGFGSIAECGGLIQDVNSTKRAFLKILESRGGIVMAIDEITAKTDVKFAENLYTIMKGSESATLSPSRVLNKRSKFWGTIITTCEKSLFADGNVNMGEISRVTELEFPKWCKDSEHAERLCEKLNNEHGTATEPYISGILAAYKQKPTIFKDMLTAELKKIREEYPTKSGVDSRRYVSFAVVIITAEIINSLLDLNLHVAKIRETLLEMYLKEAPIESEARRFYDILIGYILGNRKLFPDADGKKQHQIEKDRVRGFIGTSHKERVAWVSRTLVEELAKSGNVTNYQQFVAVLCDMGLMFRFGNRAYYKTKNICGFELQCYCVKISTTIPVYTNYNQSNLLEDDTPVFVDEDIPVEKTTEIKKSDASTSDSDNLKYLLSNEDEVDDEGGGTDVALNDNKNDTNDSITHTVPVVDIDNSEDDIA